MAVQMFHGRDSCLPNRQPSWSLEESFITGYEPLVKGSSSAGGNIGHAASLRMISHLVRCQNRLLQRCKPHIASVLQSYAVRECDKQTNNQIIHWL